MGRAPCGRVQSEEGFYKGPWTEEEDAILIAFIKADGEGNWRTLPKRSGLKRCRKSCRLRWMNYLRPDLERGNFSPEEDELIIKLHSLLENRWSLIAGRIPGRKDNEIKNYWNSRLRRRLGRMESDPICREVVATPLSIASLESSIKVEVESSCSHLDTGESSSLDSIATNLSSHFTTPEPSDQEAPLSSDAHDISNFPQFTLFPSVIRQGEAITSTPSSHETVVGRR
ncbi:MYB-like transcription factor 4 isoform X1 [Physcomitrium patens]|uniref:Uncharacterized protein n=1 Tax=Physcomitrium patens TaxID=3218 RepID=A0A2K1L3W4_PHYPA|nr:myb-related protein Hv1-like isoform X1 [Physcomitrium patens]PNR60715.1 hypothetical protein PHYPA_003508 [Physcomitrium patens]|eukprot:XP_024359849.1 myb-related protein Hv1-like isoform X1 [Physcomitrella patens]